MSQKVCEACNRPLNVDDAIEQCDCPAIGELAASAGSPSLRTVASEDAKRQILELWLSAETNEARLILEAFKIGLYNGRRVMENSVLDVTRADKPL